MGNHHASICDPEIKKTPAYTAPWEVALTEAKPQSLSFRHVTGEGRKRWMSAQLVPVLNDEEAVVKVLQVGSDITDIKSENGRRDKRLGAIEKSLGLLEFQRDGRVRSVNAVMRASLGAEENEILALDHAALCETGFAQSHRHTDFWDKLMSGETVSGRFPRIAPSGARVWLRASYVPLFDGDGRLDGVMMISHDVTSSHRASLTDIQKVRKLEKEFVMAELDLEGEFLDCNDAFLELTGLKSTDVTATRHAIFFPRKRRTVRKTPTSGPI